MKNSSTRVLITGTGAVSGAGADIASIWKNIEGGQTAIAPYEQWDGENWPVKIASEVKENNRTLVPNRKLHKSISRTDMIGLYAIDQAVQGSGLLDHRESLDEAAAIQFNDRTGIIAGSGGGNYTSNYDYFPLISETKGELPAYGAELGNMVTPMWLLKNLPNNVLCHAGINFDFKGTNACITNQCLSGLLAVVESAESIASNEADRMAAVGHDAPFEPENVLYYHSYGLMSDQTPRPFDKDRDGTVFGEGAAAVVLENQTSAENRKATVYGEILGAGCVSEARGILDLRDDGDGVSRAIELALDDAGIAKEEIGMICAHGNSNRGSDASEAIGIHRVFGDGNIPPVTAFKWAYGHLIAASGIIDLAMSLEALKNGVVPGIPTLAEYDPSLPALPVSPSAQKVSGDIALILCRGFGGMNLAVLVRSK